MFNNPDSGAKFRIISLQFKRWSMVYTEVWSRLPRGLNPPGPLEVTRPKDGGKSVWDFWIYKFMITLRERTQFTILRFGSRPLAETHPVGLLVKGRLKSVDDLHHPLKVELAHTLLALVHLFDDVDLTEISWNNEYRLTS